MLRTQCHVEWTVCFASGQPPQGHRHTHFDLCVTDLPTLPGHKGEHDGSKMYSEEVQCLKRLCCPIYKFTNILVNYVSVMKTLLSVFVGGAVKK